MKKIDPSELVNRGYTEAADWHRKFGKAYGWPNIILAVTFFIGSFFLLFRGQVYFGGVIMLTSFVIILFLWCFLRHSKPDSPITGKRLTQYLSTNPMPRNPDDPDATPIVEIVYVDHNSKKFFKHVFVENGTGS